MNDDNFEAPETNRTEQLIEEGEIAADYLEEFLDIAYLDGDIDIDVKNDRAQIEIVAENPAPLLKLAGNRGYVLDALQDLTRLAVQTKTGERSRLMLDMGGYRVNRRIEVTKIARETIEKVLSSGKRIKLRSMNAFERKIVHDIISEAGLKSVSHGVDPHRYIEVSPLDSDATLAPSGE